jgi:hypothetical protein
MAMENTQRQNYITEKILVAFLAGCIPIYYGTPQVFDVFTPHAFNYYNISDPQPALQQIQELATNATALAEMQHQQPILAHGDSTIQHYFSLSEEIGGGFFKHKIRTLMQLPPEEQEEEHPRSSF